MKSNYLFLVSSFWVVLVKAWGLTAIDFPLDAPSTHGTGKELSFSTSSDTTPPSVLYAYHDSSGFLTIKFSEPMDGATLTNNINTYWLITYDEPEPAVISVTMIDPTTVILKLDRVLKNEATLVMQDFIRDLAGNRLPYDNVQSTVANALYELSSASTPLGAGTIDAIPPAINGHYDAGRNVSVNATPAASYIFVCWSGDLSGSANPAAITMDGDKSIVANFTRISTWGYLDVSVNPPNSGSIFTSPQRDPADGKYAPGTSVQLLAIPNTGFVFSYWSGDSVNGLANPTNLIMTGDEKVTANFVSTMERRSLQMQVSPTGGGTVAASPQAEADGKYARGTIVTLTANPASGYQFSGWTGTSTSTNLVIQVTLTTDLNITANFALVPVVNYLPGLRRQIYTNIAGTSVVNLTGNTKYPDRPDQIDAVSVLESQFLPGDAAENYGQRLTGWLVPPQKGLYRFYLAADDEAQVFLSTDESPDNKQLIVQETAWTPYRYWEGTEQHPARTSASISLEAQHRYYLEVLHKEGTGGDNVAVAWQLPGGAAPKNGDPPIGSESLVYLQDMPEILWRVEPVGSGKVSLNPAPPSEGRYAKGTVVNFTAVPIVGYRFTGWSGALTGTANPAALTINGNPVVTAHFALSVQDITQPSDSIVATSGNSPGVVNNQVGILSREGTRFYRLRK
jgi:uncharacterized repeat protein (TIGR02543 family)